MYRIVSGTEQVLGINVGCYSLVFPENGFLNFSSFSPTRYSDLFDSKWCIYDNRYGSLDTSENV